MLSDTELRELCQRLGLSQEARAIIDNVRSSRPSRPVQSGAGNVTYRYPSHKMGGTIQAESHNEFSAVLEFEFDLDVLEYYDQPPKITLRGPTKQGSERHNKHTADYFVIRTTAVGWVECKMEEKLVQLAERNPYRFVRGEDGNWHCPPGEQYAEQVGLRYWLRSSAQIDRILERNLRFLADYLRSETPQVGKVAAQAVDSLVRHEPGIALDELLRCAEGVSSDEIYTLIAVGTLYVDWRAAPFAEPDRVHVYPDQDTARAYGVLIATRPEPSAAGPQPVEFMEGTRVEWDGRTYTMLNLGVTEITLLSESKVCVSLPTDQFDNYLKQGKLIALSTQTHTEMHAAAKDRLSKASPQDFIEATRRYHIIAPYLAGDPPAVSTTPARTIRLWLARWRAAEQIYGQGYVGLIPRRGDSGNRKRKLDEATLAAMHEFIATKYETRHQRRKRAVYAMMLTAFEGRNDLQRPSYKTFCLEVNRRHRHAQVEKRMGRRAAYPLQPFYREPETRPRHGDRPFEVCHVDHTQLDVELVSWDTGCNLGRPWGTVLTDGYSRRALAVYLTFQAPSYRSCMMILRLCVQRYARLPEQLMVDGGPEFQSTYFETLLAAYGCNKSIRPPAEPRFGSILERFNGTMNTQFVHNLAGNTQIMKNVRQVTKAVNPQAHACWTLGKLYEYFCRWAYETYDTMVHSELGQTPHDAYVRGLARGGERPHRRIVYDDTFTMMTLPRPLRGTAKVDFRQGVKINNLHYFHDAFREPGVEGTRVEVRYDPFDAGVAYAYVKGRWVRCIAEHHGRFSGRSEKEVMLASAELRRRRKQSAEESLLTAKTLGAFLTSVESEELLLQQRLQDVEHKHVLRSIGGGLASEDGPAQATPEDLLHQESAEGTDGETPSDAESPVRYGDYT